MNRHPFPFICPAAGKSISGRIPVGLITMLVLGALSVGCCNPGVKDGASEGCSTLPASKIRYEYSCQNMTSESFSQCLKEYNRSIPDFRGKFTLSVIIPGRSLNLGGVIRVDQVDKRVFLEIKDHISNLSILKLARRGDDLTLRIYDFDSNSVFFGETSLSHGLEDIVPCFGFDIGYLITMLQGRLPLPLDGVGPAKEDGVWNLAGENENWKIEMDPEISTRMAASLPTRIKKYEAGTHIFDLSLQSHTCDAVMFSDGLAQIIKFPKELSFRHHPSETQLIAAIHDQIEWYAQFEESDFTVQEPANARPLSKYCNR